MKRYFLLPAKIAILLVLLYVLYRQVFENRELSISDFVAQWRQQWQSHRVWYLLAAIALMPINWALEVAKWLPAMRQVQPISSGRAAAAILAGAAVSLFTPNRIGEYGGRILLVEAANRPFAVVVTLLGSWAQWMVLLAGGLLAFFLWGYLQPHRFALWLWLAVALLALLILALLLLMYRNIQKAVKILTRFKWLRPYFEILSQQLHTYQPNRRWLWYILRMASARYIVYFSQYFLMLQFWGMPMGGLEMLTAIGLIYFAQTGIPLPPSTGLIARGNIAFFVFALFLPSPNTPSLLILSATFGLWLLNVLLPALLGGGVLIYAFFWQKESDATTNNQKT